VQDYPATHFEAPHRTFTATAPFNHNQCSLSPRASYSPLLIFSTPPTLSPLFEPLLFALVPLRYLSTTPTLNNHKRSVHVLLSFVRWQEAPSSESSGSFGDGPGSAGSLGVPTRLRNRIRGYPAMLPEPAYPIQEARQAPTSLWSARGARC